MTADELKVTILRAARPGDIVFFQVTREPDHELRSLIVALASYLRAANVTPVMLPESITVVGSAFVDPKRTPAETDDVLRRLENWHIDSTDQEGLYELLSDAFHTMRHLRGRIAEFETAKIATCTYTQAESGISLWLSQCGREFCLDEGMELDAFCRWCGGQIEEVGAPPPEEPPMWKPFDGIEPPVEIQPPAPQVAIETPFSPFWICQCGVRNLNKRTNCFGCLRLRPEPA